MELHDPQQYFLNDPDLCIKLLEEKIQEVVKDNPGITTKSVLQRTAHGLSNISEETRKNFTRALCNSIDKGMIMVDDFVSKKGKHQAQLIPGIQLKLF